LELHGKNEHRLLQQAALGAHLVGGDRFEFRGERGVQNTYVVGAAALVLCRKRVTAGEKRDSCSRQKERAAAEKPAARGAWVRNAEER
jgi:hypothetical protein